MDSQPFINYLLQFGTLNQHQIELIQTSLVVKQYKPGEYFLKAGQVSKEFGFITNGIFRICYYEKDGNEMTRYFVDENHFVIDMDSYTSGIPTVAYVEAVVDCEVLILSKQAMDNLSNTILIWNDIIHKIMVKALAEKVSRISVMLPKDATERYQFFLDKFPNMANRIPLQYIAAYIGITKHSLSRIRKNKS